MLAIVKTVVKLGPNRASPVSININYNMQTNMNMTRKELNQSHKTDLDHSVINFLHQD